MIAFWQFASALIISYLGLAAGFLLASVTREELPTGRKFFPLLERIAIFAVMAVVLDFFSIHLAGRVAAYVVLLLLLLRPLNLPLLYAFFGFTAAFTMRDANTFLVISSIIFLSGMLFGSDYFAASIKKKADFFPKGSKLLLQGLPYFIAAAATLFASRLS